MVHVLYPKDGSLLHHYRFARRYGAYKVVMDFMWEKNMVLIALLNRLSLCLLRSMIELFRQFVIQDCVCKESSLETKPNSSTMLQ